MKQPENLQLTSTEVAALWTQYMNDSLAICTLQYFLSQVKDGEIRRVVAFGLELSQKHIASITQIFNAEGIPIPIGLTDHDVKRNAPPLYADSFALRYMRHIAKITMAIYGTATAEAVRQDIRNFYYSCGKSAMELYEQVMQVLLSKGLYIRAPYIPKQKQVSFVESPSFLGGILGNNRPLNAVELAHIFGNIQANGVGRALLIGFGQVATSQEVRQYMVRGQDLAKKHSEVLSNLIKDDDLSLPKSWDSEVTDSTVAPFSDKLMMQHTTTLTAVSMGNYGLALGSSTRVDIAADYMRLMAEVGQFGEDGVQLMIKNRWLEQPPQAADRKELALSR